MSGQDELREKALRIHHLLLAEYGEPRWRPHRSPLEELVRTILSQNTSDVNSGRAYEALRARYPTWEEVLAADTAELAEVIRAGGLGPTKAPRIQQALRRILAERGALSLDFLMEMDTEEARRWLLSLEGVGPKTAAIVLLFALGRPAFPVDTHVHRVVRRLGLVPWEATPETVERLLEQTLPAETFYAFHLNLIAHGRRVCKAPTPRCALCRLQAECGWYRTLPKSVT